MRAAEKRRGAALGRSQAGADMRFDANSIYHYPSRWHRDAEKTAAASPAPSGLYSSSGVRRVRDERLGECLVWRPVEGPPLPRRFSSAPMHRGDQRLPVTAHQATSASTDRATVVAADCVSEDVSASTRRESGRRSPPRGQLLPRGKGGIDDVLKNAREAQSLFHSLQERRLKAEYRSSQQHHKAELDQQRQQKRMLELAAYQAELVNIYGPTMRDIIADTFFDDGYDPVLATLRAKRQPTAPALLSARRDEARSGAVVACPPRKLWEHSETPEATVHGTTGHEREALLRALDERRCGRRSGY